MRFAEVFLRLGCSLVGWMLVVAYFLWLAVAGRVGCDADGAELHRLLLFSAPVVMALAFLITATGPMPDVHRILRWVGVFPALLMPFILLTFWTAGQTVYVAASPLCGAGSIPLWQQLWVPVQALAVVVCLTLMARIWLESTKSVSN